MQTRMSWVLLALGLLVGGCGLGETGVVTPEPTEPPVSRPTSPPTAPGAPLSPQIQEQVRQLIGQSLTAFRGMPGYEVTLRYFQSQDTKTSNGLYQIAGKGNSVKIVVQEGNGKGSRLLYTGGNSLKARPGGLLSPLVVTLSLDDPKVMSVRGYRINQILVPETLGQLMDPANTVLAADSTPTGYHLLVGGPKLLNGCRTLEAWIDGRTLMPTRVHYSDGRAVVFWMSYENLRRNGKVSLDI